MREPDTGRIQNDLTILVTGPTGQVGHDLMLELAPLGRVVAAGREVADLAVPSAAASLIRSLRPAVIVNAAAYTAVDRAEAESDLCRRVNAAAVGEMAEAARETGALFVHYSTDYVFDGTKRAPYVEDDPTNPRGVYGTTKLEGEAQARAAAGAHVILRTSWVYASRGSNFMRTMLRLARERRELRVVNDQIGSPTSSRAIAHGTRQVIEQWIAADDRDALIGTYHMSARGATSWFDFAGAILDRDPKKAEQCVEMLVAIPSEAYPTAAERPRYSVLDCTKIARRFAIALDDWETQLDAVLSERTGAAS